MSFKKPSNPEGDVKANWTDESAFNVDLALKESRYVVDARIIIDDILSGRY